jgi:hypothetical protein
MAQAFTLKSFKGGISDWEDKGIRGAFKSGSALSIRRRRDSLYCNQGLITADNVSPVVVDLIIATVPASDGKTYLFGASKIYEQASNGTITLKYTDPDGQICGAEEMWQSNGKKYLFWATSTKLKCKEIPGSSDWSDVNGSIIIGATTYTYPKVNLTASTNHFMAIANGALMICNGNYLAMVGWDGSYTNEALRLLPDMLSTSIIDKNDFAIIATKTQSGRANAHLFQWETGSLNIINKQKISAASVNALIDGEVMLMQGDTDGQLFFGDFVNRLPITQIPSGGQVNPSAIIEDKGVIYMGVYGSTDATKDGIYSYGRNKKNGDFTLNLEYPITCTEIGALEIIDDVLHVSYRVTTNYYWYKVNSAAKQVATYESLDLVAPVKEPMTDTTWLALEMFLSALPAGTSIQVKYQVEKSGSWVAAQLDGDTASLTTEGTTRATFNFGDVGEVIEVQIILTPNGNVSPEVHKAKLYFE